MCQSYTILYELSRQRLDSCHKDRGTAPGASLIVKAKVGWLPRLHKGGPSDRKFAGATEFDPR
jgi:hypothetical protein